MTTRFVVSLTAATCLAAAVHAGEWTTSSHDGFAGSRLLDAGSNLYVSAAGRVQMINRWDLNNDGHLDIVMPSGHCHTEKEDTYIYLNSGQDIDGRSLIKLAANGSRDGLIADFNKDGFNDLAVANGDNGITTWTDSYIYFGSKDGLSVARRLTLPARACSSMAAGDFNGDGWIDLAIACQWRTGELQSLTGPAMSFVYWNSKDGFDPQRRTPFTYDNAGATAVAAADLDRDGTAELIQMTGKTTYIYGYGKPWDRPVELPFAAGCAAAGDFNGDRRTDLALSVGSDAVVVLLAGADGISTDHPIRLPARAPQDIAVADFDGDGLDDIAVANYSTPEGATWIDSYVYFSDGKDFTTRPRVDLPGMGASGISAGDLNGDGRPELVISNQRVLNQQNIPSCVYWNVGGSFAKQQRTELETQGSVANTIGDINHDGRPDVVFFNFEGNFRDGPSESQIYWGDGTRNYSPLRRTDLSTFYITSVAHADLDDDGHVDLILTQSRFVTPIREELFNSVIICWGGPDAFERKTRLIVDYMAGGVRIADFNRDGRLDLLIGATSSDPKDPKLRGVPIFWGSAAGYTQNNRSIIAPAPDYPRTPMVSDLNNDGWLDLTAQAAYGTVTTWWGDREGFSNARTSSFDIGRNDQLVFIDSADLNKDGWLNLILPNRKVNNSAETSSFIYYGSAAGFSSDRREELPSTGIYEVSVADLDRDSWLDMVFTSYQGNFRRDFPAYVYWGGKDGFKSRPRTELPTYASSGIETADYDGDGRIDLLFSNHRIDGSSDHPGPHNHRTNSMLYWGDANGYSPSLRWDFPSNGPHAMNLRDVGNGVDRGLYEDLISTPHELPSGSAVNAIRWEAQTPLDTRVALQLRSGDSSEKLEAAAWHGPSGADSWYTATGAATSPGRWVQYRVRLHTPNGGPTPYLTRVTVAYN